MSFYTEIESIEDFEKNIKEHPLCVVDFYAPWCGPCKKLAPELERVVTNNENLIKLKKDKKIQFLKINVDENQDLVEKLTLAKDIEITTIPLVCFYENGNIISDRVNSLNVTLMLNVINNLVSKLEKNEQNEQNEK